LPEDAAQLSAPSAAPPGQPTVTPSTPAPSPPSTPALNLPSAASLAAEGIAIPTLRLELHAYSERARDRFVFINGRKYAEGDRLTEGPQVVAIEPTGAVLMHSGRRFLLVQD
jgi:general secretion pathway protein B